MQNIILTYFLIINITTFILFGTDKFKATKQVWRIKENTLLFFSLIGGFIGGLLGMIFFHHKTQKTSFQIKFYLIFTLWLGIVIYLLNYFSN